MKNALLSWIGIILLTGCTSSKVVYKSQSELNKMEQVADTGRDYFKKADYAKAEKIIQPLCLERTVNQPLYQSELSSIYLLAGEKEKAHQMLMLTQASLAGLYDESSERRAASVWGNEAEKVYKGEPYERCSLYLLLAMSFLDRGDPDNALAAVKSGLLADTDSKTNQYKVDYALLQLLGAKCYALRKEFTLRDQLLEKTFNSFIQNEPVAKIFARELYRVYSERKRQNKLSQPPAKLLRGLCVVASREQIETWLTRSLKDDKISKNDLHDAVAWAKASTAQFTPLDFNTLIVIWCGLPPDMFREGEYGEQRLIREGIISYLDPCSIFIDGREYDPFYGFGDINHQARTRGARTMDQILKDKANMKKTANNTADILIAGSGAAAAIPVLGLGMALTGAAIKGTAMVMSARSDIRHWENLPHSFAIVPLKLPPGEHAIEIRRWYRALPLGSSAAKLSVQDNDVCRVFHFRPPELDMDQIFRNYGYSPDQRIINEFASVTVNAVDANGDGELSETERSQAKKKLTELYDRNKDGKLSGDELSAGEAAIHDGFVGNMKKEEK
ncbi:MAG: hypothetical protein PHH77_01260 [Victivallaceae bacterium]|nr:hypothetical protein [Victivallaceae bacterium]